MKTIQILWQKTVVADPKDSRNSVRPLLEKAGFNLDYDSYARELTVSEWKEKIANIVWVKWIQDLTMFSRFYPVSWIGSDVAGEIYSQGQWVKKVLETWVWYCELRLIRSSSDSLETPFLWRTTNTIFTKYPNYFKKVLLESCYKEEFEDWVNAPEFSPAYSNLEDIIRMLEWSIKYSDSPDTTLARMNKLAFLQDTNMFWWEIVQTWASLRNLWLYSGDTELTRDVSTDIYARTSLLEREDKLFNYFLERIQKALDRN